MTGGVELVLSGFVFCAAGLGAYGLLSFVADEVKRLRQRMAFGEKLEFGRALDAMAQPGQGSGLYALGGVAGLGIGSALLFFGMGWAVFFACAVIGVMVPRVLLKARAEKRRKEIETQLVLALTLVANSVRSGATLPQALQDSVTHLPKPMSDEMLVIVRQIRVGISPQEALRDFANRSGMPDVVLAVRTMCVAVETGSNLPEAIRRICATIGARTRVEGRLKVLTAQGRMQGIVVGLMPLVLLGIFSMTSPTYIGVLFNTTPGNLILGVIVVLQLIAYFSVSSICKIRI